MFGYKWPIWDRKKQEKFRRVWGTKREKLAEKQNNDYQAVKASGIDMGHPQTNNIN